jgi:hypothetical protein
MKLSTADWISIAAGVVALASAIFTGLGLRWAKKSAKAAETSATAAQQQVSAAQDTLKEQSGQETQGSVPRLIGAVKRRAGGNRDLVITLNSDRALTSMDVSVTEGQGIWFIPITPGVHPEPPEFLGQRSFRAFAFELGTGQPAGLQPKESVQWGVALADKNNPPATVVVEADCRGADGQHWPAVSVPAPVDREPNL